MAWPEALNHLHSQLLPPASSAEIAHVESELGFKLPDDFREFLQFADGGFLHEFIIYSAGRGIHPNETLFAANSEREPDYPIIAVGRDASEDFGFKKTDLPCASCPVYFIFAETDELTKVANSFREFAEKVTSLQPREGLSP